MAAKQENTPMSRPLFVARNKPENPDSHLFEGIACALGAGLAWGIVFVVPLILADYPPAILSFGRYIAFGVIAIVLALRDLKGLLALDRRDWGMALELALSGNILYYLSLSAAIQLADAPLPTMLIGTLPIVIAVISNVHDSSLSWRRLLPPLAVIAGGIALVNRYELAHLGGRDFSDYLLGALLGCAAVACWTWYPLRNAYWLRLRPQINSGTWATAQGLATLPLAVIGMAGAALWYGGMGSGIGLGQSAAGSGFAFPFGPTPWRYIGLMFVVGLLASWIGTLLWNRASKLLPTALSGQLIVFETLAAFSYAFIWRGEVPGTSALAGIALLVVGVLLGVRAFQRR